MKIGVLLIGVALLIIAILAVMMYIRATQPTSPPEDFFAFCQGSYVVVHAYRDLSNVAVKDPEGAVYCVFDLIKAGSDKVCIVGNKTLYVVEVNGLTRAVSCPYPPPPTVRGD